MISSFARALDARRIVAPLMIVALLATMSVSFAFAPTARAAQRAALVGVKHYYIATGDSLAFGYQPNLDWANGYSTDFANQMKAVAGLADYSNYACPGETTATMLNGGCPYWYIRKTIYSGSQINAVVNFINGHVGQVSPVTLDIGANDLGNCYSNHAIDTTCGTNALNAVRTNLPTIVSRIKGALHGTGDLLLMNYYDPYQNENPSTLYWVQQLNAIIAQVASQYGVPVVNVYGIFHTGQYVNGGNPYVCNWTWMCSFYNDIHANSTGYAQIAAGFEAVSGY